MHELGTKRALVEIFETEKILEEIVFGKDNLRSPMVWIAGFKAWIGPTDAI